MERYQDWFRGERPALSDAARFASAGGGSRETGSGDYLPVRRNLRKSLGITPGAWRLVRWRIDQRIWYILIN